MSDFLSGEMRAGERGWRVRFEKLSEVVLLLVVRVYSSVLPFHAQHHIHLSV